MNISVVIPAAGMGTRMRADGPKQFLTLGNNKSLLAHTIEKFVALAYVYQIVVALPEKSEISLSALPTSPQIKYTIGGKTRALSVVHALQLVESSWVMVHDAARPCVTHADINALVDTVVHHVYDGAILGYRSRDSLKKVEPNKSPMSLEREHIWHALTPQLFRTSDLSQAYQQVLDQGIAVTDDAQAIENLGLRNVKLVSGRTDNIKVTYPGDLALAQFILTQQQ